MNTAVGTMRSEVHDGELRLRFPQLPGEVVRLYCIFSEAVPPAVPLLLGLNDTLDTFRLTFDGTPGPDGVMGRVRFDAVS